ncbi:MAG: PilZ domain-containing protein [Sphingomonas sp.]|nr:PilZ domain-containing protein [Sphingomonas sp.]
MGDVSFLQAGTSGKRTAKRARVLLSAKLKTPAGTLTARLRDLSRKGALLECATTPPSGTEVVFERGATKVPANVAWSAHGRLGLEFHYMIDENELLVHIGRRTEPPASPYRFGRAALTLGMNAKERKAAQAWSVTVGLTLPERGD